MEDERPQCCSRAPILMTQPCLMQNTRTSPLILRQCVICVLFAFSISTFCKVSTGCSPGEGDGGPERVLHSLWDRTVSASLPLSSGTSLSFLALDTRKYERTQGAQECKHTHTLTRARGPLCTAHSLLHAQVLS